VIAADQSWPERRGLDQLEWLWRPGNRAARLEEALLALSREGKIDLRMASDLLTDDLAPRAPRVVAAVLGLARRAGPLPREASEIASLLERWDGSMAAESSGAATYHLVLEHLLETLLREPFGDALFDRYLEAPHVRPQIAIENLVLRAAKLRRPGGWTDEARVSEAARTSLRRAWVSLNHRLGPTRARWTWGGLHTLKYDYLGPGKPLVGPLAVARPASGNGQTMLFSSYRPGVTFEAEQAGMIRMALDLASPDHLLSALSPGQSEHPGHRHFLDGAARWSSQRLSLFATRRLVIEEEGAERLLLEPSP
jgi:acyl-homoserine lactone acylase PvdQ